MKGSWHYTEAERLLAEASQQVAEFPDEPVESLLRFALVHATLAGAAASTVHAFFDDDEPDEWAAAFADGHALEAEQAAAIVDANLSQTGNTPAEPETSQERRQRGYARNRAQGRDTVESAGRAMLGLT